MSAATPLLPLLVQALADPTRCAGYGPREWDRLVRQARRANLLARLALALGDMAVPAPVRPHLDAALLLARRQQETARREVGHIGRALAGKDGFSGPVVLLKGAAYLMAGLRAAEGRMFSDVDILVPREQLPAAETALMVHGWAYDAKLDAYDSRYYHRWMHELPPLSHRQRGTTVDVHHTLLPPTARTQIDSGALFEQLVELPDHPGLFILPPADMLLHSATHLFHEGEFESALRDLYDLDTLMREFSAADPGFWIQLLTRARRIGLARQLHHALRYTRMLLDTPVPEALITELRPAAPGPQVQSLLDRCYRHALRPQHASCELPGSAAALQALFIRSHWLRMPALMLAGHLARKQIKRWTEKPEEASEAA